MWVYHLYSVHNSDVTDDISNLIAQTVLCDAWLYIITLRVMKTNV